MLLNERLTDRKTAEAVKANMEGLIAKGCEVSISDMRYVKLAEYENRKEDAEAQTQETIRRILEHLDDAEEWYE